MSYGLNEIRRVLGLEEMSVEWMSTPKNHNISLALRKRQSSDERALADTMGQRRAVGRSRVRRAHEATTRLAREASELRDVRKYDRHNAVR